MTNFCQILIVAPDRVFRRSLEFALEAEGYTVKSYSTLSSASVALQSQSYSCAIIDEPVIKREPIPGSGLQKMTIPVILLVDRSHPLPQASLVHYLIKPIFGNALINEIRKLTGGT
ncbi:DNA-binding response OmpR family regulator [Phyllobacterium sp. P30BS-XVII]|nr:DNA-binding response OmpR family regulator [Phyllobacterium sp. P30BS-XVII]